MFVCDIGTNNNGTAYREKLWTEALTEFEIEKEMIKRIAIALYGLKISGVALRAKLVKTLMSLG